MRSAFLVLGAMGRDRGVLGAIGVGLARNTRARFDAAKDPEGFGWAPLLPVYALIKKGAGILRASAMRGGLQGSIISVVQGRSVIVGSNKIYAAVHQFGTTIRPVCAGALVFKLGIRIPGKRRRAAVGTVLVFTESVTIPASRAVAGLVQRGLVRRGAGRADAREVALRLSAAGSAMG